jgi:hypothetical protein
MLVSLGLRIWLGKGEETVLDDWAPLRQIDFAISLKLFRTRVPTPTPRTPHRRNSHRTNAKRPVTSRPAQHSAESGRQPDRPPEQDRKRIYAEATSKKGSDGADDASRMKTYRLADLSDFDADPGKFYDSIYRAKLRPMTARIIAIEGPTYEDVLIQRIARAHGFNRAASRGHVSASRQLSKIAEHATNAAVSANGP